jgi:tryptophan 2,3-dioxygenase
VTRLTYAEYLNLDALLRLQETRTPDTARRSVIQSEQFFIVTHQACELWLKQVTTDLEAAAAAMESPDDPDDAEIALEFLDRTDELLRVLYSQVVALEKLPLRHFAEFRTYLDGASGAQSAQFRTLARLLGNDSEQGRLYRAFALLAEHRGVSVADVCLQGPAAGILHRLADSLLDVANAYWRWKMTHLALVSKMVGGRAGTGGTSGVDFLARRVTLPFPELRELRARAHGDPSAPRAGSSPR